MHMDQVGTPPPAQPHTRGQRPGQPGLVEADEAGELRPDRGQRRTGHAHHQPRPVQAPLRQTGEADGQHLLFDAARRQLTRQPQDLHLHPADGVVLGGPALDLVVVEERGQPQHTH